MALPASQKGAWSDYWEKGFLTTFTAEAGENYSGLIKNFWWRQLQGLESGSTIVDLGAGNGAILALVIEFMKESGKKFNLIAVDYANIYNSEFYQKNDFISVLGNTSIEDMNIEEGTVDLCVSQFGFEYAERRLAVEKISKILKQDGKFRALMHNTKSSVTMASNLMMEQIDLCQKTGLTKTVEQLLKRLDWLSRKKNDPRLDKKASDLRERFNHLAASLLQSKGQTTQQDHIDYYLAELSGVFSQKARGLSLKEKLKIIQSVETDSQYYRLRMEAMVSASQNEHTLKELSQIFSSFDFTSINFIEFGALQSVIAWQFEATLTR